MLCLRYAEFDKASNIQRNLEKASLTNFLLNTLTVSVTTLSRILLPCYAQDIQRFSQWHV